MTKIHRAIGFSNLHYSLSEPLKNYWANLNSTHSRQQWWMSRTYKKQRENVISDIIFKRSDEFISSSRNFSALRGGRFNSQKSHGMIYCSKNPLLAALEVTYHTFRDTEKNLRSIGRFGQKLSEAMNTKIPESMKFLIAVLSLDVKIEESKILDLTDLPRLRQVCKQLGFGRYIDSKFDFDFIYGNAYDVSSIIGAYAISKGYEAIRVGSARYNSDQHHLNILDNFKGKVKLLPQMELYKVSAKVGQAKSPHPIELERFDLTDKVVYKFFLENVPLRRSLRGHHIKQYPDDETSIEECRTIEVQKFYDR